MESSYQYRAHAHWTLHKRGILEAEDIPRTVNFAAPPEFGGEPGLWTPEHLLLGSVATCYVATFRAIAERSKLEVSGLEVFVEGVIKKDTGGFRFTEIVIRPVITVEREADCDRAHRLAEKAEQACLISRSLSAKLTAKYRVDVAEPVAAE
ncbi:MAG TPA: OsmC family protein [Terriglobales bacterium]|nr:OsmC family protein [Terriglobales bacterium]